MGGRVRRTSTLKCMAVSKGGHADVFSSRTPQRNGSILVIVPQAELVDCQIHREVSLSVRYRFGSRLTRATK
jgi:hypothetical protein